MPFFFFFLAEHSTRIQNQLVSKQIIVITGGVGAWRVKETYKNRDWVHIENRNVFYFIYLFIYLFIISLLLFFSLLQRVSQMSDERNKG